MKINRFFRPVVSMVLTFLCLSYSIVSVPEIVAESLIQDDLKWEIDLSKGTPIPNTDSYVAKLDATTALTQFDGENCLKFSHSTFFIDDLKNQLAQCDTFYIDYKIRFESFPVGIRDNLTSDEYPIAIFTWIANNDYSRSIRIDSQGNLFYTRYTDSAINAKLELQKWYNFRFAITPETGAFEIHLDNQPIFSKIYNGLASTEKSAIRFFDTAYEYEAYVKNITVYSNNGHSIEVGKNTENSADYLGYQTTKPVDGKFDIYLLSGIEKTTELTQAGYNVSLTAIDKNGKITETQEISDNATISESIVIGEKNMTAAEMQTGYLSVFTVKGLDISAPFIRIIVRPYIIRSGLRSYGYSTVLFFYGDSNNGYPILSTTPEDRNIIGTVPTCNDTFIQAKYSDSPRGDLEIIEVKNNGVDAANTRVAYFQFDISGNRKELLLKQENIKFRVYLNRTRIANDTEIQKGGIEAKVYATESNWNEKTLTANNVSDGANILKEIGSMLLSGTGFIECDVTEYMHEAILDGKDKISFCIKNAVGDGSGGQTVFASKESGNSKAPNLFIPLSANAINFNHEINLTKCFNYGYEPWGYAEQIVAEWMNGGKDAVYETDNNDAFELTPVDITSQSGAHTVLTPGRSSGNPPSGTYKNQYARTIDSLIEIGYNEATTQETCQYDIYGGITNSTIGGKATGFFHVERIAGRFYVIDPIGNPFFAVGVNGLNTGDTQNQKDVVLDKFGSTDKYWNSITKSLRNIGVNTATGSFASSSQTSTPINGIINISGIASYMGSLGLSVSTGGSSAFAYNDTMNVFDPDFIAYVDNANSSTLEKYKDNDKIIGYTSDNELPKNKDMLLCYLTLDPSVSFNAFSYAAAWAWLSAKTGKINPSLENVKPEYYEEFKAFVYSRLFKTVSEVIEKYDPNHMYIGTRADSYNKTSEGYLRAAGRYCDLLTINMYDGMEPSVATMATIYRYSGRPFIVTEFYAKAEDAYDMNGQLLANQQNAGWVVKTQQDRANYYENYTLLLLESRYCVGWIWYRFRDNDQSLYTNDGGKTILRVWAKGSNYSVISFIDQNGNVIPASGTEVKYYSGETDTSNLGSNKGIVDNKLEFYAPIRGSISRVNDNIMKLTQYFDTIHEQ